MGNLEKPLTWGLVILFVGYLFMANCECGEGSTCALNNGFNISNTDLNGDVLKVDAPETVEEDIEEDEDDVESIEEDEIDDEEDLEEVEMLQGSNDSLDMMEQAEEIEEE